MIWQKNERKDWHLPMHLKWLGVLLLFAPGRPRLMTHFNRQLLRCKQYDSIRNFIKFIKATFGFNLNFILDMLIKTFKLHLKATGLLGVVTGKSSSEVWISVKAFSSFFLSYYCKVAIRTHDFDTFGRKIHQDKPVKHIHDIQYISHKRTWNVFSLVYKNDTIIWLYWTFPVFS